MTIILEILIVLALTGCLFAFLSTIFDDID